MTVMSSRIFMYSIFMYEITDIKEANCISEGWTLLSKYLKIYGNSHEKEIL